MSGSYHTLAVNNSDMGHFLRTALFLHQTTLVSIITISFLNVFGYVYHIGSTLQQCFLKKDCKGQIGIQLLFFSENKCYRLVSFGLSLIGLTLANYFVKYPPGLFVLVLGSSETSPVMGLRAL